MSNDNHDICVTSDDQSIRRYPNDEEQSFLNRIPCHVFDIPREKKQDLLMVVPEIQSVTKRSASRHLWYWFNPNYSGTKLFTVTFVIIHQFYLRELLMI
jgi:hypothetical protein